MPRKKYRPAGSGYRERWKKIREVDAKISTLEAQQKEKEENELKLKSIQERKGKIIHEIGDWRYLQDACSKDGLRALEIDSVAPVITGYANDLLTQTFGPTFTVRFRTQDEETGREVLDILVIREDGAEVLLDNLSGGEKVWVLKSLRLAMTLLSKEKSGRSYQSLFADEEDGPLSKENAVQFIMLYRTLMDMALMDTCFFISHRPEALELADHFVRFNGKGIAVE